MVTVDGTGVVSRAGTVLLRELADRSGLTAGLSAALAGSRSRQGGHGPEQVAVDLAVMIADGGEVISDLRTLADQSLLHGPVASTATAWRVLGSIDTATLAELRRARAVARERAWAARGEWTGTEPPPSRVADRAIAHAVIDLDATLVEAHSDKDTAAGALQRRIRFPSPARVPGQHRRSARRDPAPRQRRRPRRSRSSTVAGPRAGTTARAVGAPSPCSSGRTRPAGLGA